MPSKTPVAGTGLAATAAIVSDALHRWPVARLPGCGPARARALAARGVRSVWDLLHTAPRLAPPPPPWHEQGPLPPASPVRLRARLLALRPVFHRGRGLIGRMARADGTELGVQFFQAGWLRRLLVPQTWYTWEGRSDATGTRLLHPRFLPLPGPPPAGPPPEEPGVRVRYGAEGGVGERGWQALVAAALGAPLALAADPLGQVSPGEYQQLLRTLHQPPDAAAFATARAALADRELAALAWRLQEAVTPPAAIPHPRPPLAAARLAQAQATLPWPLTAGQAAVWAEVAADLAGRAPMCRLVQGDVGSGKTAIAFLACVAATSDGAQALVLAPTTVLAEQLHRTLSPWLAALGLRAGCLTGATPAGEARAIRDGVADATLAVAVGTHVLLGESLQPRRLGLVVIDESHRFGVAQRMLALTKPAAARGRPDVLLLSATPIPRSLALTLYGELPISVLQGLPPGRLPVATAAVHLADGAAVVAAVRQAVAEGEQVFVVCGRREEDAAGRDSAAVHAALSAAGIPAALAHGELAPAALAAAVEDFARGQARVLVATSVIEVGIDVPAATLMLVVDAERFGVASLHQLRGRVGRGAHAARCLLGHAGPTLPERLALLLTCHDGFAIADADLLARGPGDLLGMLQAGQTRLRLADLSQDLERLRAAHRWAHARRSAGTALPEALAALLQDGGADLAAG